MNVLVKPEIEIFCFHLWRSVNQIFWGLCLGFHSFPNCEKWCTILVCALTSWCTPTPTHHSTVSNTSSAQCYILTFPFCGMHILPGWDRTVHSDSTSSNSRPFWAFIPHIQVSTILPAWVISPAETCILSKPHAELSSFGSSSAAPLISIPGCCWLTKHVLEFQASFCWHILNGSEAQSLGEEED